MNPDFLGTSGTFTHYASIGGDTDLVAANGAPCRWIRVGGAGDIVLKPGDGGSNVTIVGVTAGETLIVSASDIISSGTTATEITVFW